MERGCAAPSIWLAPVYFTGAERADVRWPSPGQQRHRGARAPRCDRPSRWPRHRGRHGLETRAQLRPQAGLLRALEGASSWPGLLRLSPVESSGSRWPRANRTSFEPERRPRRRAAKARLCSSRGNSPALRRWDAASPVVHRSLGGRSREGPGRPRLSRSRSRREPAGAGSSCRRRRRRSCPFRGWSPRGAGRRCRVGY